MNKILISIPSELASKLRVAIPSRQRSQFITSLITREIEQLEEELYLCALGVEKDKPLNDEMNVWDVTVSDGLKEL
jgi:hypothetical protein